MELIIGNWKSSGTGFFAPRELEAVLHCANDFTVKEAAKAMGISPETLKKRLESARFKLKVSSIRSLVLESFRRGIISPAAALCLVLAVNSCIADDDAIRVRRGGTGGERRVELRMTARRVDDARMAA